MSSNSLKVIVIFPLRIFGLQSLPPANSQFSWRKSSKDWCLNRQKWTLIWFVADLLVQESQPKWVIGIFKTSSLNYVGKNFSFHIPQRQSWLIVFSRSDQVPFHLLSPSDPIKSFDVQDERESDWEYHLRSLTTCASCGPKSHFRSYCCWLLN